jgi:[ribosomal protein S5]-alanine N-acetyltransferase
MEEAGSEEPVEEQVNGCEAAGFIPWCKPDHFGSAPEHRVCSPAIVTRPYFREMPGFDPAPLDTPRLTLRQLTLADVPGLYAIFSDAEVTRYWSTPPWAAMAEAEASIRDSLESYKGNENLRLAIALKESDALVGVISLYRIQHSNRRGDIGYALAREHWRLGYLSEAMEAFIGHAFGALDLNRIEADIDPRNTASQQLLEKMAFTREGYMRERWIVNGEVCDTAFYGLLRRDWEARA